MALPSTGIITAEMINIELKRPANTTLDLNEHEVRVLANVMTGTISYDSLYGKSADKLIRIAPSSGTISYTVDRGSPVVFGIGLDGTLEVSSGRTSETSRWLLPDESSGKKEYEWSWYGENVIRRSGPRENSWRDVKQKSSNRTDGRFYINDNLANVKCYIVVRDKSNLNNKSTYTFYMSSV